MKPEHLEIVKEAVQAAVKETVNGKIDRVYAVLEGQNQYMEDTRLKLEEHFERVEPVIKAYEDERAFNIGLKQVGDRAIYWSKIIGAIVVLGMAAIWTITKLTKGV